MISLSVQSSGWPTQRDLDDLAEAGVKDISRRLYEAVTRLSPVDTGSFRASWRVSFNSPDRSVTNWPVHGFPIGFERFVWPRGFQLGDTVIISNSQPYAEKLDEGYSNQAPMGVTRLAVAAIKLL